jgi:hypothetical protein
MRRPAPYLVWALVALQAILSVAAAACLFDHAASPHAGHHHGPRGHSTLCVWACQANPGSGLVEAAPPVQPVLLALFLSIVSWCSLAGIRRYRLSPRGPPSLA